MHDRHRAIIGSYPYSAWPACIADFACHEGVFLVAFFVLAVTLGPFSDSDGPTALLTGFAGVAAMAVQNAAQRLHLSNLPPTTLMMGNTIQVTLDAVDLLAGVNGEQRAIVRTRFRPMFGSLAGFAVGCAVAAAVYACIGFWCL
jgi:uncharacterized membrane protein YoaK (UPF0700 family)